MKTYLELEGKLGPKFQPQPDPSKPAQPNINPHVRKETKATEKRKKIIPTKKYKVKVVASPEPTPKISNTTVQPPLAIPSAPTNSEEQNPLQTSDSNPPPLKNIPTHAGTPWPEAGKMSGNLFKLRKDWPIPPATTSKPPIKIEPQTQEQATPSAAIASKAERCGWGLNCPICENNKEDWDGDHQKQFQQNVPSTQPQSTQHPQTRNTHCPQPQNFQHSQSQTFDVPDRYSDQIRLHKEWEEKMEKLNDKYGLDYFSDSKLDSKSDRGEEYRYENKYEHSYKNLLR